MVNVSLFGIGTDHQPGHAQAIAILINMWRNNVIVEASPIVPGEENWGGFYDQDRKSTRLNSSHQIISYAVFCLKKKKNTKKSHLYVATKRRPDPTALHPDQDTELKSVDLIPTHKLAYPVSAVHQ